MADCKTAQGFIITSDGVLTKYNGSDAEVAIPTGVTSIGAFAFYQCTTLVSVRIPAGVASIGRAAFCECTSLKKVHIPDSVTSIGEAAFYGCRALADVSLPSAIETIDEAAFGGCNNLPAAVKTLVAPVAPTAVPTKTEDSASDDTSVLRTNTSSDADETPPHGSVSIDDATLEDCTTTPSVTAPNAVTVIGKPTVQARKTVRAVVVAHEDIAIGIGEDAVSWCNAFSEFSVSMQVTEMGQDVLKGSDNRTASVSAPAGLRTI